jgi:hypothetical protein
MKADPSNQFASDGSTAASVPATPRARGKRATDGDGGGSIAKKPRTPKKKVKEEEEEVVKSIEGDTAEA